MTATTSLSVAQALAGAQRAGLSRIDAQLLLGHVLGQARSWLIAHDDRLLEAAQRDHWQALLARRLDGEPLAYLTGQQSFHGLALHVSAAVLDPRADTETLVDWALERLTPSGGDAAPRAPSLAPRPRVLDLGTGSGAIALAIAHRCAPVDVTAVDRSADALAVAAGNGRQLGLAVDWRHGSWFEPVAGARFDLIVSNPPYIAEGDPHLSALRHEPRQALVAGLDGLDDLRTLVAQAPTHLNPGGWLLLEHGHDQAGAVQALLRAAGFDPVDQRLDLAGHVRCSGGCWPS
ncbi:MAG: peptide chain release factor N(5)-glutamine methyltransferase [Leptothrix sp. (in: b-proteobacteria)]